MSAVGFKRFTHWAEARVPINTRCGSVGRTSRRGRLRPPGLEPVVLRAPNKPRANFWPRAAHRCHMEYGVLISSASDATGPLVTPAIGKAAATARCKTVAEAQPGILTWLMGREPGGEWRAVDDGRTAQEILRSLS